MRRYIGNCVGWPKDDVHAAGGLCDMIDAEIQITRRTFLKHVDRDNLASVETELGYAEHRSQGLTMAGDYHVSYHRSKLHGRTVYYFKHSAIEYVFAEPEPEPKPDFEINNFGSIVGLTPMNPVALEWITDNVAAESWQWLGATLNIDQRYADDLIEGIQTAGLTVAN